MVTGRPPAGAGPLGVPTSHPGTEARALSQMRTAIDTLNGIIGELQPGSDVHTAVMNAVKSLSRHASPNSEVPDQQKVELRNLQANADKNANIQQLMRSAGAGLNSPPQGAPPGAPAPGATPGAPGATPRTASPNIGV